MVGVSGIPAKRVPFDKEDEVGLPFAPFQVEKVFFPLRTVKCLGGMILKNYLPDGDIVEMTIPAE